MLKNQPLKTIQGLGLLALLALIALVTVGMLSQNLGDPDLGRANHDAKSLALQLSSGGLDTAELNKAMSGKTALTRAPASVEKPYMQSLKLFGKVGRIGKDPWGNAFHYHFIEDSEGQARAVVVWSNGPNQKKETKNLSFEQLKAAENSIKINFAGDDLGYAHLL